MDKNDMVQNVSKGETFGLRPNGGNPDRNKMWQSTKFVIIFAAAAFVFFSFGILLALLTVLLRNSIGNFFAVPAFVLLHRIAPPFGIISLVLGIIAVVKIWLRRKKTSRLVMASIISLFLVVIFHLFSILFEDIFPDLKKSAINLAPVFLFIAFPVLGIISNIISFCRKSSIGRLWSIAVILLLILFLTMYVPPALNATLPYIYTPPALTRENITIYNKCIKFLKKHEQYKTLRLTVTHFDKEGFSKDEIRELERLFNQLYDIKCYKFVRDSNMVLFYKVDNSPTITNHWLVLLLAPMTPIAYLWERSFFFFLPVSPGVLYSLNGENPNGINSEVLNANKPFVNISGNWYMSRNLVGLIRETMDISIPKSLIDRSLCTDGIDPNELHQFD